MYFFSEMCQFELSEIYNRRFQNVPSMSAFAFKPKLSCEKIVITILFVVGKTQ